MAEFLQSAQADDDDRKWYYLRALGNDARKDRAHFHEQFPALAADLLLPPVFNSDDYFSSVLRISSRHCRLWTHYDTMDNVLVQVRGRKSIIFYGPFDAQYLYLDGDKSPILCPENADLSEYPLLEHATPFHATMEPGDIVFIPALWFHNVRALDFSVAINAFWYHLSEDCYDKKDVYGNKDPLPVVRANQSVDSAIKALSALPEEYRHLYGLNLVRKITQKLLKNQ